MKSYGNYSSLICFSPSQPRSLVLLINESSMLQLVLESSLAFILSRRVSRLFSGSIFQSTSYSARPPMFFFVLSIVSLFSSLAAAQSSPIVRFQPIDPTVSPSPFILSSTTSTMMSSPMSFRRRSPQTSTPLPFTVNSELINQTAGSDDQPSKTRNPVQLVVIIIICSLMCGLTILGNLVVILAVSLVRKLQTASNILIVSLAVSDILVGILIMPLAMGKLFPSCRPLISFVVVLVLEISNNNWILGSVMCDIWTSTDVFLCTSSILNFLVISIDRYCIINHPFKYAPMRKVKLLSLMITGVWVVSALVSLPPILGWGRTYSTEIDFLVFCFEKLSC